MASDDKYPALLVRASEPFNAEPPAERLLDLFVTPEASFFIRSHGPFPPVDPASYCLTLDGMVRRPLSLSLDALQTRFPKRVVTATLQCAGNRRQEMMDVAPIPGETPWDLGAISNGEWGGVALCDLLVEAGVEEGARHAAFMGLDEVERHSRPVGFGGSVPIEKAMRPEVLLAYEMNGAPLTAAHGFPLRVVAPGYIGARSVKWLDRITLQPEPSSNYFQAHAYKLFPSHVRAETADWARGLMLGELSVNAVICRPGEGQMAPAGEVVVQGYAMAGGARTIERVDLSTDDGESWMVAQLLDVPVP